jgi:hypothetical protein
MWSQIKLFLFACAGSKWDNLLLDPTVFLVFYDTVQYAFLQHIESDFQRRNLAHEAIHFLLDVRLYKKIPRHQRIIAEEEIVIRYFIESSFLSEILPIRLVEEVSVSTVPYSPFSGFSPSQ